MDIIGKEEEMDNWKKQILVDPILSSLFDEGLSEQDMLLKKIMPLPHGQIAATYSKLSTLNFDIMKSIQKQVQSKNHYIENSFVELLNYKQQTDDLPHSHHKTKPTECLSYLKNFNLKYEKVEQSLILWKNITNVLHFSKGLQTFRVNANILKTLMRGYNGNADTINPIKVAKMIKQLTQLSTNFNFNGIKAFEAERVFISSTKSIIHQIGTQRLPILLQKISEGENQEGENQEEQEIVEWIHALWGLGTLREFVINFFKSLLVQCAQKVKKNIQNNIPNLSNSMKTVLVPFFTQVCKSLIYLQEKLITMRKIQLSNVPNLFIRFWEKLCEFLCQTIIWTKKQQESRNIPKNRQSNIILRYPFFYSGFTKVCSEVECFFLGRAQFNMYSLGKNKQKLVVVSLMQLATAYHAQVNKSISKVKSIVWEQKKDEQDELLKQFIENISMIFEQVSCHPVYNSVLNSLCKQLKQISAQVCLNKQKDQNYQNYANILNEIKTELKKVLALHGSDYGISRKQLQAFQILSI